MRMYAHFLGYSSAEGGVVEIFTQDTFDMGSIDVLTMEHEFDDFEFNCQWSGIFEKSPANNESFLLMTNLGGGIASTIVPSENIFILDGARTLNVGEYIWIENERIKILDNDYDYGGDPYYLGERGSNGSFSTSHFVKTTNSSNSNMYATTKRVSPIGSIVKIYRDDDTILGYGQVTLCSLDQGTGVVRVSCSHLYRQLEQKLTVENTYRPGQLSRAVNQGYLDFFCLLSYTGLDIDLDLSGELSDDEMFFTFSDLIGSFTQLLNVNNVFLHFDKSHGVFEFRKLRRLIGDEEPVSVLLFDNVSINGSAIDVQLFPHISSATLSMPDGNEVIFSSFDSNYTKEYTQGNDVKLDFSGLANDGVIDYEEIAKNKLFFLANVIEKLEISVQRYTRTFDVGGFYRFLDIYKIKTFFTPINDNVFLCISQDDTKCSFIRVLAYSSSLVAPAVIMKKTGFGEFEFIGDNYLSALDYVSSNAMSNGTLQEVTIESLRNPSTGTIIFEVDDEVTMVNVDGSIERPDIETINGNVITFSYDFGGIGDVYIMSIESNKPFASLQNKNKAYIYEGEGVL